MSEVLVDTSAWIDFFRSADAPVSRRVTELVEADRAILTGPVLAELLHGVRSASEARRLESLLAALPFVDVERVDWHTAGTTLQALRRRGLTIPLSDAVIGSVAQRHRLAVLTLDKHFDYLPVQRVPVT